jgi:hypothetical protein
MNIELWIDKQGGSHYHKSDCEMVKDPHFHYEPIKRLAKFNRGIVYPRFIVVDKKMYYPCACVSEKRGE